VSGFITLDDGRMWTAANWFFDTVIEGAADALEPTSEGKALAWWLRQQTSDVMGPGLGSVDIRGLTSETIELYSGGR
jgi:hypothetical protein